MTKRKVLFICTGNVFRSLSAELLLKRFLAEQGIEDMEVSSRGIAANPSAIVDPRTVDALAALGIEVGAWLPQKVAREDLEGNDVVIVMAEYHREHLEREFGFGESVLFNEVLRGERTSVLDIDDVDLPPGEEAIENHIRSTIGYINGSMPALFKELDERYTIFLDFITGRKKQNRGYEVVLLHETERSAAFMSASIPVYEDAHVLVVPKKRYEHLHNVPREAFEDMMETIRLVGRAFNKKYEGYNVLLNNGKEAGQNIPHVHFHIIPRRKGDGIVVQEWRARPVPKEEFEETELHLKELIEAEAANA